MTQNEEYVKRAEHTLTAHDGKLWIIGGSTGSGKLGDVWTSSDGADWELTNAAAPFGKRNFHQTVTFHGKLWVIGGIQEVENDNQEFKNDVWSSADGVAWESETEHAGFPARGFHKSLVFDDKIWVIGGGSQATLLNDIWYSEDGKEWIEVTPENSFPAKDGFTTVFYQNKVWILGGSATSDVWYIPYHEFE